MDLDSNSGCTDGVVAVAVEGHNVVDKENNLESTSSGTDEGVLEGVLLGESSVEMRVDCLAEKEVGSGLGSCLLPLQPWNEGFDNGIECAKR